MGLILAFRAFLLFVLQISNRRADRRLRRLVPHGDLSLLHHSSSLVEQLTTAHLSQVGAVHSSKTFVNRGANRTVA